jgi:hypothetical protein
MKCGDPELILTRIPRLKKAPRRATPVLRPLNV